MGQLLLPWHWRIFLVVYCGMIFWLSSQSRLPVPDLFNFQDKVLHATAYALMALLFWQSAGRLGEQKSTGISMAAVMFCSLYGISDEWHQSFVPGRDASLGDWLADTLGAMLVSGILCYRHRNHRRI